MPRASENVRVDEDDNKFILCHYTSEQGLAGILSLQQINPSLTANNPNDARYGDGVYVSDIPPGTMSNIRLARQFFGVPRAPQRFSHYVCLDVTGLNPVYGRPHVYVIHRQTALPITGRIVATGRNE